MKKLSLACITLVVLGGFAVLAGGALVGCSGPVVSEAQQKSKVEQMNEIAKMDPDYDKKQAQRAQRGR